MTQYVKEKLLFRGQFILGSRYADFIGWHKQIFCEGYHLTIHPEVNYCRVISKDKVVLCLGSIIDPSRPGITTESIVSEIVEQVSDFSTFEKKIHSLAGRWLIFINLKGVIRVYPDAIASFPAYHVKKDDFLWVASTPQILAETLALSLAEELISEFESHKRSDWWPGQVTRYQSVGHLWPNHFMSVPDASIVRFWPNEALGEVTIDEAASRILEILKGILLSASQNNKLHLALTAGYDSRVLLGASREFLDDIAFFTIHYPGIKSYDLDLPKKIAKILGLKLRVKPLKAPTKEFLEIFDHNSAYMVSGQCRINAMTYQSFPPNALFVEGTASEIGRNFYYSNHRGKPLDITPEILCKCSGFNDNRIALQAFSQWLASMPENTNVNTFDLFYWEQRVGNWSALDSVAQETVRKVMAPFNCRELLALFLSAPKHARCKPYPIHTKICKMTLPELNNVKFNYSVRDATFRFSRRAYNKVARTLKLPLVARR
ncbi:MAG: hypothetical protein GXP14_09670 [Gammaproteobacteria bacterium]|nr:hypothetical protein [Gammaproteobacteria bacterium]